MKNLIFLPFILFSMSMFAQEIKIGPVAGFNLSHYKASEVEGLKTPSILRLQLGLIAEIKLTDQFKVKSGLILVGRGTSIKLESSDNTGSIKLNGKVRTTNFQLPLLVGYTLPVQDLDLTVYTGPSIGFALGGKAEGSWWETNYGYSESESNTHRLEIGNNDSDNIKSTDMGWEFAVGASLSKFNLPLNVSLSYTLGLTNIIPNPTDNEYYKNRSINITIAYLFKIKG